MLRGKKSVLAPGSTVQNQPWEPPLPQGTGAAGPKVGSTCRQLPALSSGVPGDAGPPLPQPPPQQRPLCPGLPPFPTHPSHFFFLPPWNHLPDELAALLTPAAQVKSLIYRQKLAHRACCELWEERDVCRAPEAEAGPNGGSYQETRMKCAKGRGSSLAKYGLVLPNVSEWIVYLTNSEI